MKKLKLTIVLMLLSLGCLAQQVKSTELNIKGRAHYTSYSIDGNIYNVGDTIRMGEPSEHRNNYKYVKKLNNPILFGQGGRCNDKLVIIEDMRVKGNENKGYRMEFITSYPMSIFDYYLVIRVDNALKTGEVQ